MAVYDNPELGPEFLEQLEESLVMADVGIETSDKIIDELNKAINYKYITREREIKKELSRILTEMMDKGERNKMKEEYPDVFGKQLKYSVLPEGEHDYMYIRRYIYNALPGFFR